MKGNFGMLQYKQPLFFAFVKTLEPLMEGRKRGVLGENRVEARVKLRCKPQAWVLAEALEICVSSPDFISDFGHIFAMRVVQRDRLVHPAFRMDPAQGMQQYRELPGPVADDNPFRIKTIFHQSAQKRSFSGHAPMPFIFDAEVIPVWFPTIGFLDGAWRMQFQTALRIFGQTLLGIVFTHIVVEEVMRRAGLPQFKEVDATFTERGAEAGEGFVADVCDLPVLTLMTRSGVVHIDIIAVLQADPEDFVLFLDKRTGFFGEQRVDLTCGNVDADFFELFVNQRLGHLAVVMRVENKLP